jgi:hypothetical protein
MKQLLLVFCLALMGVSCVRFNPSKLTKLTPGMSKADVLRELDTPAFSASGGGNVEVLHYKGHGYHYVRFVDGKLESFGPENMRQPVTDKFPPIRETK